MTKTLTYKDAGVDIEAAEKLVDFIRPLAKTTFRKEVISDIGGFGGVIAIDQERFPEPYLVASTDGVGTKLRIAFDMQKHDTIGQDLVAMCVNDIIVQGATPLFFMDYFATGKLDEGQAKEVIQGIVEGCRMAQCALIGGETAEMPSFYPQGEYELAGFSVGIVNRNRLIEGKNIKPGDVLIGLASNGLHSNGYSLVRKVFSREKGYELDNQLKELDCSLGEELLKPTRIYVQPILALLEQLPVKGLVHITGGGFIENIPRILPKDCRAEINLSQWTVPPIFKIIENKEQIQLQEMLKTFNYGIGMMVILSADRAEEGIRFLQDQGETCFPAGEILPRTPEDPAVMWI